MEKIEIFTRQVLGAFEHKKITETNCKSLLSQTERQETWDGTFDLYEQLTKDFIHALIHHEYYDLLERIDKGEAMEAAETDPVKKRQYRALLKIRYAELEKLMPKGEVA